MLHQKPFLTLTSWPSFFDNGSHILLENGLQMLPHKWQYPNSYAVVYDKVIVLIIIHTIRMNNKFTTLQSL